MVCKINFCSAIFWIRREETRRRRRRRKTQAIAKRYAFHSNAKNNLIIIWKKENCKMSVFFLIVLIDKTIRIIDVIATKNCCKVRKPVENCSISTLALKSSLSQTDIRIFKEYTLWWWTYSIKLRKKYLFNIFCFSATDCSWFLLNICWRFIFILFIINPIFRSKFVLIKTF